MQRNSKWFVHGLGCGGAKVRSVRKLGWPFAKRCAPMPRIDFEASERRRGGCGKTSGANGSISAVQPARANSKFASGSCSSGRSWTAGFADMNSTPLQSLLFPRSELPWRKSKDSRLCRANIELVAAPSLRAPDENIMGRELETAESPTMVSGTAQKMEGRNPGRSGSATRFRES